MTPASHAPGATLDRRARLNLLLLATCQALGQAGNTMMFAATALSVVTFYPQRELATLPTTMQHLGIMLWVFPAALLMQRRGRQLGFRVGSVFGMAGATIAGTGLYFANLAVMCLGGLVLGYAVAALHQYRFAAVELVPAAYRAKAISWVTAGGVVAGVLGPSLVRWTHDQWVPIYLATFAAMVLVHLTVFTIMGFIRFPAPDAAPAAGGGQAAVRAVEPPRPLLTIAAQPRFAAAAIAGMIAFGTMSFLMSASPLAIVACGLPHTEAHWVIFMHVMGMFVPSFFTGNLITRYGTTAVMLAGIALLGGGVAAALAGLDAWHFRAALTLNGVGWNFLFVGATTLVTTCYRPNERGKVQAFNDFLVFGTTATASFLAGYLQERLGWFTLNWFALLLMAVALAAVGWLHLQNRAARAAA
ncbi:MFS transporter [Roseomonas sp. JC162]|uniref:MFS transporter n=1 Tax=Neoroseomonas marina TaxID=1232220 RepID=A0A848EGX5_9PROT|nr:MFS transporter [Neoroseomonas marina]NMJ42683.1 MFS transporter [Neoroseomonas marina]